MASELAEAVLGALLSKQPSSNARQALAAAFPGSTSYRVALPLGRGDGVVIVSSNLAEGGSPTTFWATSDCSLVARALMAGRTAVLEGDDIHRLADTQQLHVGEGAASFLCVPVVAAAATEAPRPATAVLLLAYPSSAAVPEDELRLALRLAGELSVKHGKDLQGFAERLHSAVHPDGHTAWGPGLSPDYPLLRGSTYDDSMPAAHECGASDDEDTSASCESGSTGASTSSGSSSVAAAAASPRMPGPGAEQWSMDPRTLWFADSGLERRFLLWRGSRLAQLDSTALVLLLAYHFGAECLPPPAGACTGWLPALTVLLPLLALLLLLNRSRRWYSKHRDHLLLGTYVLLASHHALDLSHLAAAPDSLWRTALLRVDAVWCVVLGLILQVQFVGQCFMLLLLAIGAALRLRLQPGCPGHLASHLQRPVPTCLAGGSARGLLLKLVLPCALAYLIELSARCTFFRSVRPSLATP